MEVFDCVIKAKTCHSHYSCGKQKMSKFSRVTVTSDIISTYYFKSFNFTAGKITEVKSHNCSKTKKAYALSNTLKSCSLASDF